MTKTTILKLAYRIVKSPIGDIGIIWKRKDKKVIRILLPEPVNMNKHIQNLYPGIKPLKTNLINHLSGELEKFLKGTRINFSLKYIDLSQLYGFQKKVLLMERKIPYGWVSTYGRLAKKIGKPYGARAVGNALARNPFPLIIPCHRIVRSDGSIGGYQGGVRLKRRLLELEGVKFNKRGNVVIDKLW